MEGYTCIYQQFDLDIVSVISYHVHVLSFSGVGSRSLLDHLASPTVASPSLPCGDRIKSANAAFDLNGAVTSCFEGSVTRPMVAEERFST